MTHILFSNWTIIRILRLVLGIGIVIQAMEMRNYWMIVPAVIFTFMALFNAGCGSNNCSIPLKNRKKNG